MHSIKRLTNLAYTVVSRKYVYFISTKYTCTCIQSVNKSTWHTMLNERPINAESTSRRRPNNDPRVVVKLCHFNENAQSIRYLRWVLGNHLYISQSMVLLLGIKGYIYAFGPRYQIHGRGLVALANQYRLPINSVCEDLPIILREVGTASPYSKD